MSDTPTTHSEGEAMPELSYFDVRMQLLGVTEAENRVKLNYYDAKLKTNSVHEVPVFTESIKGIDILVYGVDRGKITYAKQGSRHKVNDYKITRLETPIIKKDGSEMKYQMPKGIATQPFFPPRLLDKYEAQTDIPTLYITEGYFKAFKAQMHGLDCVGLPSITCMKDRETGKLHEDVAALIKTCKVQRVVWLVDGDCRNITTKEIQDGIDLYKRPRQFFNTAYTFSELLSGFDDLRKYFAYVNSDNIEGTPKGLDDLLIAFPDKIDAIKKEALAFDKKQEVGNWFVKFDITFGTSAVHKHFMLHDVDVFYHHHAEKRSDLKNKDFKFNGTLYRYDEENAKCAIKIPSSAASYFRVGDKYYEYVSIPNRFGDLKQQYHAREKGTITDDNGKDIFKHIPKYKAFCTVPSHVDYQRIINGCFNLYFPVEWEPEQGECETTIDFIKHIFGTEKIKLHQDKEETVERWELGMDYLTILYKTPQQILPILSLVSTERQTGKTTFAKWLNMIYTENMAIVGNEDLGAQFNSHWASKLIVACDETKIDKHVVMEKIKSLSTAGNIMMNAKGRDQLQMEFFAKFILMSNNEDDFARIDKEEIRFWVIKVPRFTGANNVDLLADLREEIPAFLHYLNNRKMVTERRERHWFETRLLRTEALEKVMENSRPTIEKQIRNHVADLFENSALAEITMPLKAIGEALKRPQDLDYIKRSLHAMGYKTEGPARRSYPRLQETEGRAGGREIQSIAISFFNRYYRFERAHFTDVEASEPPPETGNADTEYVDEMPF